MYYSLLLVWCRNGDYLVSLHAIAGMYTQVSYSTKVIRYPQPRLALLGQPYGNFGFLVLLCVGIRPERGSRSQRGREIILRGCRIFFLFLFLPILPRLILVSDGRPTQWSIMHHKATVCMHAL